MGYYKGSDYYHSTIMQAKQWFEQGQLITVNQHRHFVYDSDNGKPALLILHGYPTCSYDYYQVLPILEAHFRLVIHDHLGFGYSDKPKAYSYALQEQADQALQLWHQLGIDQAVVLAHDYGTSVATEILARYNENADLGIQLKTMVLCNGSMHIEMSQLRLIQKLLLHPLTGPLVARLSSQRIVSRNIKQVYYDPARATTAELEALWAMMQHNQGRRVLHQVTQYIKQRYQFWDRWIGALQQTRLPIKIVWAKNDPVAVAAMAQTLHAEIADSELLELDELGHFPMLEDPQRWSDAVLNVLGIQ